MEEMLRVLIHWELMITGEKKFNSTISSCC